MKLHANPYTLGNHGALHQLLSLLAKPSYGELDWIQSASSKSKKHPVSWSKQMMRATHEHYFKKNQKTLPASKPERANLRYKQFLERNLYQLRCGLFLDSAEQKVLYSTCETSSSEWTSRCTRTWYTYALVPGTIMIRCIQVWHHWCQNLPHKLGTYDGVFQLFSEGKHCKTDDNILWWPPGKR